MSVMPGPCEAHSAKQGAWHPLTQLFTAETQMVIVCDNGPQTTAFGGFWGDGMVWHESPSSTVGMTMSFVPFVLSLQIAT
jgi:hypothetical protein